MFSKTLPRIAAIMAVLLFSLLAHAQSTEHGMLKVTISVDGMMKSKSGAT